MPFTQPGTVTMPHYDENRNFIAILKGQKRYILQPPGEVRPRFAPGPSAARDAGAAAD